MSVLLHRHGLSEDEKEGGEGEGEGDTDNSIVIIVLLLLLLHCRVVHRVICYRLSSVDGEVR